MIRLRKSSNIRDKLFSDNSVSFNFMLCYSLFRNFLYDGGFLYFWPISDRIFSLVEIVVPQNQLFSILTHQKNLVDNFSNLLLNCVISIRRLMLFSIGAFFMSDEREVFQRFRRTDKYKDTCLLNLRIWKTLCRITFPISAPSEIAFLRKKEIYILVSFL